MRRVVVLAVALAGCEPTPAPQPKSTIPTDAPEVTTPVPPTPALKPGDVIPPLVLKGWLNGTPPPVGAPGQKLLLIDAWTEWCPHCKSGAPKLVRLHEKYAPRGVQFVSVSNMPDEMVATYVGSARIPWPCAYQLSTDSIIRLGLGSGFPGAGYQIMPTVMLVGPDGVVRWTDERMRTLQTPPADWHTRIDAAIAAHLDGPAPAGR